MKNILILVFLLLGSGLSHAAESSVYVYDYKTGGTVTAKTTEVGAILTLRSTALPNGNPLNIVIGSAWGVTFSGQNFNISLAKNAVYPFNIPAENPNGSVSIFMGPFTVPSSKNWATFNFDMGILTQFGGQQVGNLFTVSSGIINT